MATVIRMPQLAAGGAEAAIQTWLVSTGDTVSVGQPLAEIETEKAVVGYESEVEGVFAGAVVEAGAAAAVGAPIAVVAAPGEELDAALAQAGIAPAGGDAVLAEPEEAGPEPADDAPAKAEPMPTARAQPEPSMTGSGESKRLFASPLVRRLAKEHGVDLAALKGTGPNGRIVRRDLEAHLATAETQPAQAAPAAGPAAAASAPVETAEYTDLPHTGMRRAIARRLTESVTTIPQFQVVADCRVDELLDLRKRINEQADASVSVNDLIVKAVAGAMQDVPDANAIWTDAATRRFSGVDIGIAVAVPGGLLTPVVRGVERLSLGQVALATRDLAERAREGRLKQHELEGGSFAVSNLGMYGTREFTAIINPPHSGILAVGAAQRRPVVADGTLGAASVMTVTLSADHRVLDGALAAKWLAAFVRRIESPLSILL
ncbi:dihydrolipoamide acetyltransferase family protein [Microbacterium immunditiarum]|uniref:Dihydrolipoamide acetyltransferase component of pyruvate dehydrogenase complex n=1 Tax=Microbacterium immunditiarum TaxID=337480 RepID=A0A7Y9GNA6_9MICO|nr:dihydrolipoamide acetyltransferase family protein [Microbacterium immunditiarum]NYE19559.1 pyruvate dehydrogenase E2 component (dihydrolipoamide acetyltransferase) [Microbacterium immunditiarum]